MVDEDYSAAVTFRSLLRILNDEGIRLVIARVLDNVREHGRHELRQLLSEDVSYVTLEDVMQDYQQQTESGDT